MYHKVYVAIKANGPRNIIVATLNDQCLWTNVAELLNPWAFLFSAFKSLFSDYFHQIYILDLGPRSKQQMVCT